MNLDLERPTDWMQRRGSLAVLTVGPFSFAVNTADGASFDFAIRVWRWVFTWGVQPSEER